MHTQKKVVHRDIKPANILISREGAIKLVDFGIASSEDSQAEGLTIDGMTLGTPGYMPPEQFKDSRNVDYRADIYSLGVLAYEMLTGKKPFPGSYSPELMNNIQMGKYQPPEQIVPGIDRNLLRLIKKAMKTNREKRYKDLDQIIALLEKTVKKWNCNELKSNTAEAAKGREINIPQRIKPKRKGLKTAAVTVLAFLVITAGTAVYKLGLYRGIISQKTYGRVVFTVKTPADLPAVSSGDVSVSVFIDDDKKIPSVENMKLIFLSEKDESFTALRSLPIFLKQGNYRVKITASNEVFWNSFTVQPWAESKKRGGNAVTYYRYDRGKQPLTIIPQVRDAVSGKDLLSESMILIRDGKSG